MRNGNRREDVRRRERGVRKSSRGRFITEKQFGDNFSSCQNNVGAIPRDHFGQFAYRGLCESTIPDFVHIFDTKERYKLCRRRRKNIFSKIRQQPRAILSSMVWHDRRGSDWKYLVKPINSVVQLSSDDVNFVWRKNESVVLRNKLVTKQLNAPRNLLVIDNLIARINGL